MDTPNFSITSDELLLEVKGMKHINLAIERLRKIVGNMRVALMTAGWASEDIDAAIEEVRAEQRAKRA